MHLGHDHVVYHASIIQTPKMSFDTYNTKYITSNSLKEKYVTFIPSKFQMKKCYEK